MGVNAGPSGSIQDASSSSGIGNVIVQVLKAIAQAISAQTTALQAQTTALENVFPQQGATATTATAGSATLPATPQLFQIVVVGGTTYKIPLYLP